MAICDKGGLSYAAVGRNAREAIWRAFRSEYSVSSYHVLPAIYHDNAIAFIQGWTSFALIKRLREKEEAHGKR